MAASSSAVQVRVLEESAIGVVASGNPKRYRITGESLNQTIASTNSKELRADRMVADSVITSGDAGGALNFELSHKTHDMFFEALLASTFTPIGTNGVIAISDATFNSVTHTICIHNISNVISFHNCILSFLVYLFSFYYSSTHEVLTD